MQRSIGLGLCFAVLTALAVVVPGSSHAELLQNDGWATAASAGFQGGFVAGEIGAVRLEPSVTCPCDVQSVSFLYGGAAGNQTVTLRIYPDTGATVPGTEIFSDDFVISPADGVLNVIDLSAANVTVNGPFRVGIEVQHAGLPSIARDDDGTITAAKNFMFISGGTGWITSSTVGVTGDWIIRATVEGAPDPSTSLDNYRCYAAKDLRNPEFVQQSEILTIDPFAPAIVDATKLAMVCVPADKNLTGVQNAAATQCCYKLRSRPLSDAQNVAIADDFGPLQVELKKSSILCQPCTVLPLP